MRQIAIIDFGGQYADLIRRRLQDLGVYSITFPNTIRAEKLRGFKGIILSGGPASVNAPNAPDCDEEIFSLNVPILAICYGHQLSAKKLGGRIVKKAKEYGSKTITVSQSPLFKGLAKEQAVWFSHGDSVIDVPAASIIAQSGQSISAFSNKNVFGVQFHPEVNGTEHGNEILSNFLFGICGCEKSEIKIDWQALAEEAKSECPDGNVIIAVSGGVDSTVAAFLMRRAIGSRLHCIFVDTGLMRKNEAAEVCVRFAEFEHFKCVDASGLFLSRLKGISDPEEKRKIIGRAFIEVFEAEAKKIKNVRALVQGTIFPDRVESAATSGLASKIKTHHNLALPERMKLKVVEPLKSLYKDEVRLVAKQLGISPEVFNRHPFPGPGLAIRIVGEVTPEKLEIVRAADAIFIEELKKAGYYDKVFQAFVALLSVKVVGVRGDERAYEYPVVLRCVDSKDAMTADWTKLPYPLLQTVSTRILNEVPGAIRVFYDLSQKPPATICYE